MALFYMRKKLVVFNLIVGLVLLVLALYGYFSSQQGKPFTFTSEGLDAASISDMAATSDVPDFASIQDSKAKKMAFFAYLQPAYDRVTQEVLAERAQLIHLQGKAELSADDLALLQQLATTYKVTADNNNALLAALLVRVDKLPEALVFSQSANETGWGTSRFARLGHNFFGQWCFSQGCGMVPTKREQGAGHEVASFKSIEASMRSYYRNINRHQTYAPLRQIRAQLRLTQQPANACALAAGLINYSARKEAYVAEIRSMIRFNSNFWRDHEQMDYNLCAPPPKVAPTVVAPVIASGSVASDSAVIDSAVTDSAASDSVVTDSIVTDSSE
jgi:Bax protein